MKKLVALLIIQTIAITTCVATTWETSSKGYWQDSSIWVGGVVPDTSSNDTFLISHPIVIENDLTLASGAYMLIEKDGGICGHQIATVLGNAQLLVYGILELDELYVNSGFVRVFEGDIILTTFAQIKGQGGTLKVEEEASMVVGEWFDCLLPDYSFARTNTANIEEEISKLTISTYPNPFSDKISINNPLNETLQVKLFDVMGCTVFTTTLFSKTEKEISLSFLKKGVYLLSYSTKNKVSTTRLVKN